MKPPYFIIHGECPRCNIQFTKEKKQIRKIDSKGDPYIIGYGSPLVCPKCRMWGRATGIKEVLR